MTGTIRHSVEAAGTAGILAYTHGRQLVGDADFKVMGVPIDVATAMGFGALGLFEAGGAKYADDMIAIGTGALCHYTTRVGYSMGQEAKSERKAAGRPVGALHARNVRFGRGGARNPFVAAAA